MAPPQKRFLNADTLVALATVLVVAILWFTVSQDRGYFSSTMPTTGDALRSAALTRLTATKKDFVEPKYDPASPDNALRADGIFEQAADEERAGLYKEAVNHYKLACKFNPMKKRYWSSLGSVYVFLNQYEDAQAAFTEVYKLDVYDVGNLSSLGYAALSLRKDREAERYYLMALAIQPELQGGWDELGHIANGVGLQDFNNQIQQMAKSPLDITNSALVYQLNQAALEQNPDDYYYLVNRAMINLRFMRLADVASDVDKALKINPNGAAALLARAQLYHFMGKLDKSAAAYKSCLAVSPQPMAYAELGALEKERGNIDQALVHYGKATELAADKPSWVDTLTKLSKEKERRAREAEAKLDQSKGDKAVALSKNGTGRASDPGGPANAQDAFGVK